MQLRQKRLKAARTILGISIGKAPKPKLFKFYIDLETQLAELERVRMLYGKFVEWDSTNAMAWIMFAELEATLQVCSIGSNHFPIHQNVGSSTRLGILFTGVSSQNDHLS
jgi:hypothetical protein